MMYGVICHDDNLGQQLSMELQYSEQNVDSVRVHTYQLSAAFSVYFCFNAHHWCKGLTQQNSVYDSC